MQKALKIGTCMMLAAGLMLVWSSSASATILYWPTTTTLPGAGSLSNGVDVLVTVETTSTLGELKFSYALTNPAANTAPVEAFSVDINGATIVSVGDPSGGSHSVNAAVTWTGFSIPDDGSSLSGFYFIAECPHGYADVYAAASDQLGLAQGSVKGPATPEPATLTLLGLGLAGLVGVGRKRKKK